MKQFGFYLWSTVVIILLAVAIGLMIRFRDYMGYVGVAFAVLLVIGIALGIWFLVEKILNHRARRLEIERRLELDQQAQSQAALREQGHLEALRRQGWAEELRARGDYLKAQAEAAALHMTIEQYRAALAAGLHYPGPHGSPVHISVDPATGQPRIRPTDYRALLPERAAASGNQPTDPAPVDEESIPTAPSFRAMSHLIRGATRLILCYGLAGAVYGTVDDLLSMAVTGKPGRGKTTALMYYVAILLSCGAEVVIWDPHGAMADLARLNNRPLPNMPATARVYYFDRKEDILASLPMLERNLQERDDYYRQTCMAKHPHLLLADELPVLADYDEELARMAKRGEEFPSLIRIIRRYVLEARKWRCYFIGSGQSMDADILPTRVTENLSSRIVFFSSDRRARMAGLENEAIKKYLPLIRRAGSGVMVFDCARFDEPILGAIPLITIEDLMEFLGLPVEVAGLDEMEALAPNPHRLDRQPQLWVVRPNTGTEGDAVVEQQDTEIGDRGPVPSRSQNSDLSAFSTGRGTGPGVPTNGMKKPGEPVPVSPVFVPKSPDDKIVPAEKQDDLAHFYNKHRDVKEALHEIGLGNRYFNHASWVLEQRGLKVKRA